MKLTIQELHNLYDSQNITRAIESRGIKWVGPVARMVDTRNAYKILV
jgi:hypothetical protein